MLQNQVLSWHRRQHLRTGKSMNRSSLNVVTSSSLYSIRNSQTSVKPTSSIAGQTSDMHSRALLKWDDAWAKPFTLYACPDRGQSNAGTILTWLNCITPSPLLSVRYPALFAVSCHAPQHRRWQNEAYLPRGWLLREEWTKRMMKIAQDEPQSVHSGVSHCTSYVG